MPPGLPDTADLGNGHGTRGGEVVDVELMVSHVQSTGIAIAIQCDDHDGGRPYLQHDQEGDGRRRPQTPARPLTASTLFPGPSHLVCGSSVRRNLWPPDVLLRNLEVADAHQGSEVRTEDYRGAGKGQLCRGWGYSLPGVCLSFPSCTRALT